MATVKPRYQPEEFARRGKAIYAESIQPQMKPRDKGKFVAIDIETGEWELGADELTACHSMRKRIPEAQIWIARVGFRTARGFGGRSRREKPRLSALSGAARR